MFFKLVSKTQSEFRKLIHFEKVWFLVYTVERRAARRGESLCSALIGKEHEFFDNTMRNVAFCRYDAGHLSIPVEPNFRFRQVEINGTAAISFFR